MKYYNIMIHGISSFDQPIKSNIRTYDNIQKIATGKGDDYTTDCFLDYNYFHKNFKMIAVDSSKQQTLHADPKAIQQINFTGNLSRPEGPSIFFIIEEAKETVLRFFTRKCESIVIFFKTLI